MRASARVATPEGSRRGTPNQRPAKSAANPPAVVIGLDCATGLQSARILARRGVPVIGVAADPRHPCCRTRVCQEIIVANTAGPPLIQALRELASRLEQPAVLFPCTDLSVLVLSRHREELEPGIRLVLPTADTVEMLVDKARFSAWAEQHALPVPRTRHLRTLADVEDAARVLRFPCILKPAVKSPRWRRNTSVKAFRVEDAAELYRVYSRCSDWTDSLVVQEWIEGADDSNYTCNCYITRAGEAAVAFTSRKIRQWPPVGGEGSLSVEVRNERVRAETLHLFLLADHQGLGYAEIKQDSRTGEYLIIEPNVGRPTGRSAQAEAAGVELLFTQYCDALGRPLPESREQRYGPMKWIHLRRDLQAALFLWSRGELTLREWFRSWRGPKVDALFAWDDPVPFWADLGRIVLTLARRERVAPPAETESV